MMIVIECQQPFASKLQSRGYIPSNFSNEKRAFHFQFDENELLDLAGFIDADKDEFTVVRDASRIKSEPTHISVIIPGAMAAIEDVCGQVRKQHETTRTDSTITLNRGCDE